MSGVTSIDVSRRPVGRMVLALAKVANLSLGEVAAHLDLHRNSLAEKTAGRRAFTEDEIVALSDLFGVTPGRMFDDPAELLGISELPRTSSGRSPSAGSGLSPRRSGCSPDQFAEAA